MRVGFKAAERSVSLLATACSVELLAACSAGASAVCAIQPAPRKPQRIMLSIIKV